MPPVAYIHKLRFKKNLFQTDSQILYCYEIEECACLNVIAYDLTKGKSTNVES